MGERVPAKVFQQNDDANLPVVPATPHLGAQQGRPILAVAYIPDYGGHDSAVVLTCPESAVWLAAGDTGGAISGHAHTDAMSVEGLLVATLERGRTDSHG